MANPKAEPFSFDDVPAPETPAPKRVKKPPIHSSKVVSIPNAIEELYTAIGLGISVFNQKDGEVIVENAARAGEVWDRAAKKNPRIKDALDKFLTASTLAEVLALHLSIGLKIAANHQLVPEKLSSVLTKDERAENGNGNGFPFGIDPASIDADTLKEIFPQLKEEPTP